MSVLIWIQTVCKGYQQMTKVVASKERVYLSLNSVLPFLDSLFEALLLFRLACTLTQSKASTAHIRQV